MKWMALLAASAILASSGCDTLRRAYEFGGARVWETCEMPQPARGAVKGPIEVAARQECVDDGTFTAVECSAITLSFGCPQDVVVP